MMGNLSAIEIVRSWIGSLSFRVFLWANRTTAERYWEEVYQIEKHHNQNDKET